MKKGFSPLEIMLAIAIGSMITLLMSQALSGLTRSLKQVSDVSLFDMRVIVFKNLLEKEIAGAFIPELVMVGSKEKKEKPEEEKKAKKKNQNRKN